MIRVAYHLIELNNCENCLHEIVCHKYEVRAGMSVGWPFGPITPPNTWSRKRKPCKLLVVTRVVQLITHKILNFVKV